MGYEPISWAKSPDAPPEYLTDNNGNLIEIYHQSSYFDPLDMPNEQKEEHNLGDEEFLAQLEEWEQNMIGYYTMLSDHYDKQIDIMMARKGEKL